jgi:hypothetical protein
MGLLAGGGTAAALRTSVDSPNVQESAKLVALDRAPGDYFGWRVALSGSTAVVGAPGSGGTGVVYVFVRAGSTWSEQARLTASDGAAGDRFGGSVAISGDTVVVGAACKDSHRGAAYVFVRSGTTWSQQARLSQPRPQVDDDFGDGGVAVSGSKAVVAAVGRNNQKGATWVFHRSSSTLTWHRVVELTPSAVAPGDRFGASVALSNGSAVVGADGTSSETGVAYVFVRTDSGWPQQADLTAQDGAPGDHFGTSVALSHSTALIGSPGRTSRIGAAYAFLRSDTTWTQQGPPLTTLSKGVGDL